MGPQMKPAPPPLSVAQEKPSTLEDIATRTQPILDAGRYQPQDEEGLERLARRCYRSGMLPDSYYPRDLSRRWDKDYVEQGIAKAYLAMLKGAVLGIHPSEAIWQIHVINGRPTLSADLMFGRLLATGILRRDDFTLKADKTRCEIVIGVRSRVSAERMIIEAKYEDFKHLHRKENWQNDPEAMLVARAKARACRRYAPDIFVGVYATEEARDFREDRAAGRYEDSVERIFDMTDEPKEPASSLTVTQSEDGVGGDPAFNLQDLLNDVRIAYETGDASLWSNLHERLLNAPQEAIPALLRARIEALTRADDEAALNVIRELGSRLPRGQERNELQKLKEATLVRLREAEAGAQVGCA